jgi:16S rRNA (guanine527-N7)-methyltransferase
VAEHRAAVRAAGGSDPVIRICGSGVLEPPTTVVEIARLASLTHPKRTRRR